MLTPTEILYAVKFTFPALVLDTVTDLDTAIGVMVVEGFIEEVLAVDVEVDEVETVVELVDEEDVEEVEVDVEVVDDVDIEDTDVEGGLIIPPLPLPPPLPEGAAVVVRVVLGVDVVEVEVEVDVVDVDVEVDVVEVEVEVDVVDVEVVDVVVGCDMVIELSCMLFTVIGFDAESVKNMFADIVLPVVFGDIIYLFIRHSHIRINFINLFGFSNIVHLLLL